MPPVRVFGSSARTSEPPNFRTVRMFGCWRAREFGCLGVRVQRVFAGPAPLDPILRTTERPNVRPVRGFRRLGNE